MRIVGEWLLCDDGGPVRVRGQYAAFTDPQASDLSVLGRDVLDNFDVILSRRRDEVLLLAPNHSSVVSHASPKRAHSIGERKSLWQFAR